MLRYETVNYFELLNYKTILNYGLAHCFLKFCGKTWAM